MPLLETLYIPLSGEVEMRWAQAARGAVIRAVDTTGMPGNNLTNFDPTADKLIWPHYSRSPTARYVPGKLPTKVRTGIWLPMYGLLFRLRRLPAVALMGLSSRSSVAALAERRRSLTAGSRLRCPCRSMESPSITTTLPPFGHIWSVFSRKSLRGRQDHKAVKRVGRSP